ncbi:hypothetical protein BDW22DRAFT_1421270 [Trametopsis cervina]|nr:hypothetical protein BDW22DRAFT_1421270 [Trametopsis cervina]
MKTPRSLLGNSASAGYDAEGRTSIKLVDNAYSRGPGNSTGHAKPPQGTKRRGPRKHTNDSPSPPTLNPLNPSPQRSKTAFRLADGVVAFCYGALLSLYSANSAGVRRSMSTQVGKHSWNTEGTDDASPAVSRLRILDAEVTPEFSVIPRTISLDMTLRSDRSHVLSHLHKGRLRRRETLSMCTYPSSVSPVNWPSPRDAGNVQVPPKGHKCKTVKMSRVGSRSHSVGC